MEDHEIFLPESKIYEINGRKFIQGPLSAYYFIKLANILAKKISEAINQNPTVAVLVMNFNLSKPDPAVISSVIYSLASTTDDINEFLIHFLRNDKAGLLADEDIEFLKTNLSLTILATMINDLVAFNREELKKVVTPFQWLWEEKKEEVEKPVSKRK